ncbi:MAG: hypothetical protein ACRC78_01505 [Planktothrix sp.]
MEIIQLQNDIAILGTISVIKAEVTEFLINQLRVHFKNQNTEMVIKIADRIAKLCPRLDIHGAFGFDISLLLPEDFFEIFVKVDCTIERLINLPVTEKKERTLKDGPPLIGSGDKAVDFFAQLCKKFSLEMCDYLLSHYSWGEINCFLIVWDELSTPIEDRMNDYTDKLWKEQVGDEFAFLDLFFAAKTAEDNII